MRNIEEVLIEINYFIDRMALEDFIARGWVRPLRDNTDFIFDDVDISRIRLVCELHIDMKFDLDTVDIILSLMDQLYETRSRFDKLTKALENQPNEVRCAIIENLRKTDCDE